MRHRIQRLQALGDSAGVEQSTRQTFVALGTKLRQLKTAESALFRAALRFAE